VNVRRTTNGVVNSDAPGASGPDHPDRPLTAPALRIRTSNHDRDFNADTNARTTRTPLPNSQNHKNPVNERY
ncbi:hypothetical protein BaRGS_00002607, partial [Batillaria attramentaria]